MPSRTSCRKPTESLARGETSAVACQSWAAPSARTRGAQTRRWAWERGRRNIRVGPRLRPSRQHQQSATRPPQSAKRGAAAAWLCRSRRRPQDSVLEYVAAAQHVGNGPQLEIAAANGIFVTIGVGVGADRCSSERGATCRPSRVLLQSRVGTIETRAQRAHDVFLPLVIRIGSEGKAAADDEVFGALRSSRQPRRRGCVPNWRCGQ